MATAPKPAPPPPPPAPPQREPAAPWPGPKRIPPALMRRMGHLAPIPEARRVMTAAEYEAGCRRAAELVETDPYGDELAALRSELEAYEAGQ